jgi:DNA-binding NarL/FixJ family response regulator
VQCIILTAYDDDDAMYAAALAGAAGYVLKDIRGTALVEAIRAVAAGNRLIDPAVRRRVVTGSAPRSDRADVALTLREGQVLDLIADGLTNRQIGERLGLAEKTIKNYVSSLLDKLGLERRTQAAVYGADARRS